MVQQVDVICKNEFSLEESAELAQDMLQVLHRTADGAAYFYYSTPTESGGFRQDWRIIGKGYQEPKRQWVNNLHVYFSFNPHATIPSKNAEGTERDPRWVRGTERNIKAINALYCDIDAQDTIRQDEWLPYYVEPDTAGMTKQQAYGALQKAQTAAIDAALVASPEKFAEYKRRALEAIYAAPLAPTYMWCSGGGYQAAWVLDAPLVMTADNFDRVKHVQKAWVTLLGADPAASDLNRILRLPGTVNRKKKYGPQGHAVCFLIYVPDHTYTFEQLAALVAAMPASTAKVRMVHIPSGIDIDLTGVGTVAKLPRHPAIAKYNAETNQHELLLSYGYTDAGGGRMARPGGGGANIRLNDDNTSNHFGGADPLYAEHRIKPAHVLCAFEYGGDVAKMMEGLTGYPHPLPEMTPEVAYELRRYAQSAAARELLRDAGVRKPDGYLRTAEALIEVAERDEAWLVAPGARQLGEKCNATHTTINKHVETLNGTFWQVWPVDDGAGIIDLGLFYWLSVGTGGGYAKVSTLSPGVDVARKGGNFSVTPTEIAATITHDTVNWQRSVLPHDAFTTVAYRHGIARRVAVHGKGRRVLGVSPTQRSGLLRVAEVKRRSGKLMAGYSTVLLPGLGHIARPALAAIMADPGITRVEIAEQTGLSARTLSKTLAALERLQVSSWTQYTADDGTAGEYQVRHHVVQTTEDVDGTKQYYATDDAMRVINTLMPSMTSYMAGTRRAHGNACARAAWLYREYAEQAEEYRTTVIERIAASYDAETEQDRLAAAAIIARYGLAVLLPVEQHKALQGVYLSKTQYKIDRNDEREHTLRAVLRNAGIKPAGQMPQFWMRWDGEEIATVRTQLVALLDEMGDWDTNGQRLTWEQKMARALLAGYTEDEIKAAMYFKRQQDRGISGVITEEMVVEAAALFEQDVEDDGINTGTPYMFDGTGWVAPVPVMAESVVMAVQLPSEVDVNFYAQGL